ncbi:MAG: hypothetical protein EHM24_03085 [Acidobacteria bacterium]|nr:MAG: hypothetical protein EHM24_03085 [Acidobacteriota bacterium]
MTARAAVSLGSLVAALLVGACTSFYEIPIETPIQPKLDISAFQRVLVAGFVAGGTEEVDANLETVRLLRSQLRSRSDLRVIEADVIPLTEVASEQPKAQDSEPPRVLENGTDKGIKDEKDLEAYDHLFANANFWKKLGEEYQNPLIVTGTILFVPHSRSGFVQRDREVVDAYGRRSVQPVRTYMERKGYILRPKFIFIDGRTGTPLYSETFREEVLYNPSQDTPALSSYFELMDRLIPGFLGTLSSQKIKGSRVLLK